MKRSPCDKYINEETWIQAQICEYIRLQHPQIRIVHPANEGRRGWTEQRKIKLLGLKKGASDLFLFDEIGRVLFLEVKKPKGKLTPEQKAFLDDMVSIGHSATWCDCFDLGKNIVDMWQKK